MDRRVRVSRSKTTEISVYNPTSIGASYSWISSLEKVIGPDTSRIVCYHARLSNFAGFEKSDRIEHAYLGFNCFTSFRPEDSKLTNIVVLDLVGNPISSLVNCPPCKELIVSSTLLTSLEGCPESVEILRVGHSTHLKTLLGCPKNVKILECSCAPNLLIDMDHLPNGLEQLLCFH